MQKYERIITSKLSSDSIKEIRRQMRYHVKRYHLYKSVAKEQNSEYKENTDRYYFQLNWYETLRVVINYWKEYTPERAKVVLAMLGIEPKALKSLPSVVQISMDYHISKNVIYDWIHAFYEDVYQLAKTKGLIGDLPVGRKHLYIRV